MVVHKTSSMAEHPNILVVSDLHFGEELLPGATSERRHAVELGARAFHEFLRYHEARRLGGRPWRLVIAGDLFDFMSVMIPGTREHPARTADERAYGLTRGAHTGVARLQRICENHGALLRDLVSFAAAGHTIDIIVGNHDVELLEPDCAAELHRQLALVAGDNARGALERIRIVPWFVHEPGQVWIEHGHIYDEGCSFEYNLSPCDPTDGQLLFNADYAATRYLAMTCPEIDPHGIEEWSVWGYLRYGLDVGIRSFARMWLAYARFAWALVRVRRMHRSFKRRDLRRRTHRERLYRVADETGVPIDALTAIDRLARTPVCVTRRRLASAIMLDRFGVLAALLVSVFAMLVLLPILWALIGSAVVIAGAIAVQSWLGQHMVTSQLPMRAVPNRLRTLVDAPVVVFGHTHDPRWQPLRRGGLYVNCGTWLPATRPGLRRSFTHILIQPQEGSVPLVQLRQWRDGVPQPFDAGADLGAGVTAPGVADEVIDWPRTGT